MVTDGEILAFVRAENTVGIVGSRPYLRFHALEILIDSGAFVGVARSSVARFLENYLENRSGAEFPLAVELLVVGERGAVGILVVQRICIRQFGTLEIRAFIGV